MKRRLTELGAADAILPAIVKGFETLADTLDNSDSMSEAGSELVVAIFLMLRQELIGDQGLLVILVDQKVN